MPRLRRVKPRQDAGFARVRAGKGFRYADARGAAPDEDDLERIRDLVIPPAWKDVWISGDPLGHIQAVGVDDAGRSQYLYHPDWRAKRDKNKYVRALELADALPRARGRVTTALRREDLDRERVLATAFRLLDEAAPRVGSERYFTKNGSRGLTTLLRRDASVEATVTTLSFPAKSRQRALLTVDDEDLATAMLLLAAGRPAAALLAYKRGRRRVALSPAEVNEYVKALTGGPFTAKDFRTLRGSIHAAEALARIGPVDTITERKRAEQLAVRATAEALGNTPAIARGSYIDPRIFRRYEQGRTLDLSRSPESALRTLLLPGR